MLLYAAFLVQAQEDTWTIEERCLPEVTTPPENWSYDGTILVRSPIGIHGINQDWETRRILAYSPNDTRLGYVSPDGKYWITFQGDSICWGSCSTTNLIMSWMTIHNLTSITPESQQIQWIFRSEYDYREPEGGWGLPSLRWLSPNRFVHIKVLSDNTYDTEETPVIYDLTSGEIEVYETPSYPENWHNISPDGTLVIDTVHNTTDFGSHTYLSNPENLNPIVEIPAEFDAFNYYTLSVWSPDSEFFLASRLEGQEADGSYTVSLWLMNRNAEMLYSIVDSLTLALRLYLDILWSPDGRYLLILGNQNQISWLIDLENRHSYNLCFDKAMSAAWSPDSQQLALQAFDWDTESFTSLTIFEPASWQLYEIVDNPDASPIGWQATGE
jgi:hypothetical protein